MSQAECKGKLGVIRFDCPFTKCIAALTKGCNYWTEKYTHGLHHKKIMWLVCLG